MSGYVRKARIKIPIEGELRPYTDGSWVIFSPAAFPGGFMRAERKHLRKIANNMYEADPEAAFRDFWSWDDKTPLQAAMEGYRIELVGPERAGELLDVHRAGLTKPADNTGEEETA